MLEPLPHGPKQFLTAEELAALLQIHTRTVYKLAKRGELPALRVGGGWRFVYSQIVEYCTNQAHKNYKGD